MHSYKERRGKESWRLTVECGVDEFGKRIRERKTVRGNERFAEEELKNFEAAIRLNLHKKNDQANIKLQDVLVEWLESHCWNIKETTYISYKTNVEKHLIPDLGNVKLKKLNPKFIDQYKQRKLKNGKRNGKGGLSNRTVNYILTVLKLALDYARDTLGVISDNPTDKVTFPRSKSKKGKSITKDELILFLKTSHKLLDFMTYSLIYMAFFTGLRRGELLASDGRIFNSIKKSQD